MAAQQREVEVANDGGYDNRGFLNGEGCADTNARPDPERKIAKAVDRMARGAPEPVWVEHVRLFPQGAVPMKNIWRDDHHRAAPDRLPCEFVGTLRRTADRRNG